MIRLPLIVTLGLAMAGCAPFGATARTLEIGQGKQFQGLGPAVGAAHEGDRILIYPGEYFDCVAIEKNHLTIEGAGSSPEQVVLTDKPCEGKALIVAKGEGIVVRNMTLTRVRVPDMNGAGIRGEGPSLLVDRVRFINNQNGILAGDIPGGSMIIRDSVFENNGFCERNCAHSLYVGHLDLLRVERTKFYQTKRAHHIKSRAHATEVLDSDIEDGPEGTASFEIDIPNGGSLIARGNKIIKGPHAENHTTAIIIGEEGVNQPTRQILIENNEFRNENQHPTVFVTNLTATEAILRNNRISGVSPVTPLKGDGQVIK